MVISPKLAKVEVKNLSKIRLLPQPWLQSSKHVVKQLSYMVCLYNFALVGLFFAAKGTYTGVYRRNFFKGVSTTRLKKICAALPRWFCFREKSSGIFRKSMKKIGVFGATFFFYQKIFKDKTTHRVVLSPYYAKVLDKKHFKNSSTAPIIIIFIYKSRQENLIHDLPLQLCRKWPVFAVKGR